MGMSEVSTLMDLLPAFQEEPGPAPSQEQDRLLQSGSATNQLADLPLESQESFVPVSNQPTLSQPLVFGKGTQVMLSASRSAPRQSTATLHFSTPVHVRSAFIAATPLGSASKKLPSELQFPTIPSRATSTQSAPPTSNALADHDSDDSFVGGETSPSDTNITSPSGTATESEQQSLASSFVGAFRELSLCENTPLQHSSTSTEYAQMPSPESCPNIDTASRQLLVAFAHEGSKENRTSESFYDRDDGGYKRRAILKEVRTSPILLEVAGIASESFDDRDDGVGKPRSILMGVRTSPNLLKVAGIDELQQDSDTSEDSPLPPSPAADTSVLASTEYARMPSPESSSNIDTASRQLLVAFAHEGSKENRTSESFYDRDDGGYKRRAILKEVRTSPILLEVAGIASESFDDRDDGVSKPRSILMGVRTSPNLLKVAGIDELQQDSDTSEDSPLPPSPAADTSVLASTEYARMPSPESSSNIDTASRQLLVAFAHEGSKENRTSESFYDRDDGGYKRRAILKEVRTSPILLEVAGIASESFDDRDDGVGKPRSILMGVRTSPNLLKVAGIDELQQDSDTSEDSPLPPSPAADTSVLASTEYARMPSPESSSNIDTASRQLLVAFAHEGSKENRTSESFYDRDDGGYKRRAILKEVRTSPILLEVAGIASESFDDRDDGVGKPRSILMGVRTSPNLLKVAGIDELQQDSDTSEDSPLPPSPAADTSVLASTEYARLPSPESSSNIDTASRQLLVAFAHEGSKENRTSESFYDRDDGGYKRRAILKEVRTSPILLEVAGIASESFDDRDDGVGKPRAILMGVRTSPILRKVAGIDEVQQVSDTSEDSPLPPSPAPETSILASTEYARMPSPESSRQMDKATSALIVAFLTDHSKEQDNGTSESLNDCDNDGGGKLPAIPKEAKTVASASSSPDSTASFSPDSIKAPGTNVSPPISLTSEDSSPSVLLSSPSSISSIDQDQVFLSSPIPVAWHWMGELYRGLAVDRSKNAETGSPIYRIIWEDEDEEDVSENKMNEMARLLALVNNGRSNETPIDLGGNSDEDVNDNDDDSTGQQTVNSILTIDDDSDYNEVAGADGQRNEEPSNDDDDDSSDDESLMNFRPTFSR